MRGRGLRVVTDALILNADGTGHRTTLGDMVSLDGAGATREFAWTMDLTYRIDGYRIVVEYECPPFASCVAPPHLIARRVPGRWSTRRRSTIRRPRDGMMAAPLGPGITLAKGCPMADEYTIQIEHDGRSFQAGIRPDAELDRLLLKTLDYFDLDPQSKDGWTLVRAPQERRSEEEELTLRRPVAEQLANGDRVRLQPRNVDREEPATGSY